MRVSYHQTHTNLAFTLAFYGDDYVLKINELNRLATAMQSQINVIEHQSHLKFDKNGKIIGFQNGIAYIVLVFHGERKDDHTILLRLLNSWGILIKEKEQEVIKTHKDDGTPYKRPQHFIEKIPL